MQILGNLKGLDGARQQQPLLFPQGNLGETESKPFRHLTQIERKAKGDLKQTYSRSKAILKEIQRK